MPNSNYQFQVISNNPVPADWAEHRPLIDYSKDLEQGAQHFIPGSELEIAINTAIALGDPLLLTGEPGTGKTQVAYYIAKKLGTALCPFAVKSTAKAQDLLYSFDTVQYFYDAHVARETGQDAHTFDKRKYITKGPLWKAIEADQPIVLLLDEIDKAPRDFPNDLLHELDQMSFQVPEINETATQAKRQNRPIVVITSNSERRLPEPFLRRCVFHYIEFNQAILQRAVEARKEEYRVLSEAFIQFALERFIGLRNKNLRKKPSTAELINWLRVIAVAAKGGTPDIETLIKLPLPELLDGLRLKKLPFLGVLIKDSQDLKEIKEAKDE